MRTAPKETLQPVNVQNPEVPELTQEQEDNIRQEHHAKILALLDPIVRKQIEIAITGANGRKIDRDRMAIVAIHRECVLVDAESKKVWPPAWGVVIYDRDHFASVLDEVKGINGTNPWKYIADALRTAPPPDAYWTAMFDEENGATLRTGRLVAPPVRPEAPEAPPAPAAP